MVFLKKRQMINSGQTDGHHQYISLSCFNAIWMKFKFKQTVYLVVLPKREHQERLKVFYSLLTIE